MMRWRARLIGWMGIAVISAGVAAGQANTLIPTDHPIYPHLARYQQHGHLSALDPTALPYRLGTIRQALKADSSAWAAALLDLLPPEADPLRSAGVRLRLGTRWQSTPHLDPLENRTAVRPTTLPLAGGALYPLGSLHAFATGGGMVAQLGLRHDVYYNDHPLGLDIANRLMLRSEDAYIGWASEDTEVYLGRLSRHWAPLNDQSVLLSHHPPPFDHLSLQSKLGDFKLHFLLGELDSSVSGAFTGRAGDDTLSVIPDRRFLVAHRFDWRPTPRFILSAQESVIFSGPTATPSPLWLNPMHAWGFEVDQTPKNDEVNGQLAGSLWFMIGRLTAFGQITVDDIDLSGSADGSFEAPSIAFSGSMTYAHPSRQQAWLSTSSLHLVTATRRTYNTHQAEGKYLFAQRGIGLERADLVHLRMTHEWANPSISLRTEAHLRWQGEATLLDPFPENESGRSILSGTIERSSALLLFASHTPNRNLAAQAHLGIVHTQNLNHEASQNTRRIAAGLSLMIRLHHPSR